MTTQMISVAEFDAIVDHSESDATREAATKRTFMATVRKNEDSKLLPCWSTLQTTPPTLYSGSIFPKRAGAPRGVGRT